MPDPVDSLQASLGYTFENLDLLTQALTHRSYVAEHEGLTDNERLEYLGDAVLQLSVTEHIFRANPGLPEGEMSMVRHAVVNEPMLAEMAQRLGIDAAVRLGRGEEATGGRQKPSILADCLEAVLGALYLEAGYAVTSDVVMRHWDDAIADRVQFPGRRDYKSRLQEFLAQQGQVPDYEVSDAGPDHEKVFTAVVAVAGRALGSGTGTSKKRAEQEAARHALESLE